MTAVPESQQQYGSLLKNAEAQGINWFIEQGFLVEQSGSTYTIKSGAGYVGGYRIELLADEIINVPTKPSFIYIDAHRTQNSLGQQTTEFAFVVSATELADYVDANTQHYVCKIAKIFTDSISDLRIQNTNKSALFTDFASLKNACVASNIQKISTVQHSHYNLGAASYIKDGSVGAPKTGDELKFFDPTGNGWILSHHLNVQILGVIPNPLFSQGFGFAAQNVAILNAFFQKGVSKFYFPSGYYWMQGTLDFASRSGVMVIGENLNNTLLRWFDSDGLVGIKLGNPTSYNSAGLIENIKFFGTKKTGTDYTDSTYENSAIIQLDGVVNQFVMRNVLISSAEIGIKSTTTNNWNREFHNVQILDVGTAFQASESNANRFFGCMFFKCRDAGVKITGYGIIFSGCSFESLASQDNAHLEISSRGVNISGCYFEGSKIGIRLKGYVTNKSIGTTISGSYLTGDLSEGSIGIDAECAEGTVISGNYIRRYKKAINYHNNTSFSNALLCNVIQDSEHSFDPRATDAISVGRWNASTIAGLWKLTTNTRDGLSATVISAGHTTSNALNDVFINDSEYQWRTWLGGRDGVDGGVRPLRDNSQYFGSAGYRWGNIFCGNGTISTSDEREKTALLDIEDAEKQCALELKSAIKKFKFLDAVSKKGEENARIHFGVGAQTVALIFGKYGLDPTKYALFCFDAWQDEFNEIEDENGEKQRILTTENGDRYGIRYEQLLCFIIAAI